MPSDDVETVGALRVWDVIWPRDELIYPPKWKMWVCVSVSNLWFLRINSEPINEPAVLLESVRHPGFLDRNSWLGCGGDLIQVTEFELEQALKRQGNPARRGKVGCIHAGCRAQALECIRNAPQLSPRQIRIILTECGF